MTSCAFDCCHKSHQVTHASHQEILARFAVEGVGRDESSLRRELTEMLELMPDSPEDGRLTSSSSSSASFYGQF